MATSNEERIRELRKEAAQREAYTEVFAELTKNSIELNRLLEKGTRGELAKFYRESNKAAIQYNSLASSVQETVKTLDKFRTSTPAGKMLYLGQALTNAGKSLTDLRDKIYGLQSKLGTTFGTAVESGAAAFRNQIASLFTKGPALSFEDTINAINSYQQEFGTLLTRGEARRFAQTAKQFGTDITTFTRAQRAFLVGPNSLANQARIQQTFVTQFRAAGLTANQSLEFAAKNANLIAIAGDKYADSLARAAANATKVGVSLERTENFADTLVGDFEGALERFSELRAMGVEVDFNELARIAGTGTPEQVFNELSKQLGGNNALLDQLQNNRFLKVALEKDLGLSVAEIRRLAAGRGGLAGEKTKEENTENGVVAGIMKVAGPLLKGVGFLASAIGINTIASAANTKALLLSAGKGMGSLLSSTSTLGKLGIGGLALGAGIAGTMAGREMAAQGDVAGGITVGLLSGATSGAVIGSLIAPGIGTAVGAIIGAAIGGYGAYSGRKVGDIAMGPGKGRVVMGPEGIFSLSPRDQLLAGTKLFGDTADKAMKLKETQTIFSLLKQSFGSRFFLGKNPLIANPYLNAGMDVGTSLLQGKGLKQSLMSGGGTLAGGIAGQLGGMALGRMIGGTIGSVLGPVGSIAGGMLGSYLVGKMLQPKSTSTQPVSPSSLTQPMSPLSLRAQAETTSVNVDTRNLEQQMSKMVQAIGNMRVMMDANPVGRMVMNSSSPIDLATR